MKTFKDYFSNIENVENVENTENTINEDKQSEFEYKVLKLVQNVIKKKNVKTADNKEAEQLVFDLSLELLEVEGLPFNQLSGKLMGDLIVKNINDINSKTLSDIKNECDYKEGKKVIAFIDTFEDYRDI